MNLGAHLQMIQDLRNFVEAVWRHWEPLLVGGVIAVIISFFDHLAGNFKWVFWLLSALSLFIAVFLAWRDERHKRETEIAELNQKMALNELINRALGAGHFLKARFLDGTMAQCKDQTIKQMLTNWAQETEGMINRYFREDACAKFSTSAQEIPDSTREQEHWIYEQNRKLYELTQQLHHVQSIAHIKANRG
jgi:hypothetical protein